MKKTLTSLIDIILGRKRCVDCNKRLWTGELCEDCFMKRLGRSTCIETKE